MCQDRSHSKELGLTHEFISEMPGTRRAGVREEAGMRFETRPLSSGESNIFMPNLLITHIRMKLS